MCGCTRIRLLWLRTKLTFRTALRGRTFFERLMEQELPAANETPRAPGASSTVPAEPERPRRHVYLVRHGQTTYNLEGRLPGQLPGVALTDEGRRQAHRAAVALALAPLSAVVSSPLERARETAEIIARGWGLPVRLDERLMDTDVGAWAGRTIDELRKQDPAWNEFVQHGTQPPPGVESLQAVLARVAAVIEEIRHDSASGDHVVLVAHADVVKLIVAHYFEIHPDCIRFLHVDNASVTVLSFAGDDPPTLLALNWTPMPSWLTLFKSKRAPEQEPAGVSPSAEAEHPAEPEAGAGQRGA